MRICKFHTKSEKDIVSMKINKLKFKNSMILQNIYFKNKCMKTVY